MAISSSLTPQAALLVPINAHRLYSGPSWFYRVSKRPPVKADLAIYSLIVGMSEQWKNAMLHIKLDFYRCENWSLFANPVTNYVTRTLVLQDGSNSLVFCIL